MAKLTALYTNRDDAECAFRAAVGRGYAPTDINLVMSDDTRKRLFPADRQADTELGNRASEHSGQAARGGELGGPVGGTVGTIAPVIAAVGVAALLPGLVVAGPIAAALAAAGAVAVAGGLLGALADWGIPKARMEQYEAGIRDGGILMGLTPHGDEDLGDLAKDWNACGGKHIHT
jgi:hypothetical protein